MKKFITTLLSVFFLLVIVASCSSEPEKAEAKASVAQTSDSYDGTQKYACRHFKSLLANADVTTYQEQLKELKTVYTGMAIAYEDGNYQSGPMYHAARTVYSAAIDNNFDEEATVAMGELTILCSKVPNW